MAIAEDERVAAPRGLRTALNRVAAAVAAQGIRRPTIGAEDPECLGPP
jgi:hypothetical protein